MSSIEFIAHSLEETEEIAMRLANLLQPGDLLTLEGELGSGKTTFTKGLAKGLGITRNVNSPTFTIVKQYKGRIPLYHMDVYRLEDSDEDIGFSEYFHGDGVSVVEWAEFIKDYLPEERLEIGIEYTDDDQARKLKFNAFGDHYCSILYKMKD
ncbi:tRNA (adenosine(37)-N6)-threonylcarbamoyltransferase complex ATPase subunit type 1 TsaE [Oceanobacillus alkalisoli]|uniref:tRNA (adenosine(37)-N6)-threonylcarbamoyltransferase complex ATPase subunit type 1 TsaE n=1 Tax=Oceanobacillus alkalisoli TaxID=2925113 RepID=UPI001EF06471|nr:tRNA (adenosine(37)-N6)-threonylcarbamoyltransferase complex ATPase subunit type 1 TsaE [Oceanobacillus alkalisoli]MCF3943178.1 tRNA (adenosine(37)-N6)-threonylcarbamoyltransferase complex ATPase subunit type 1 TsaE [Oceanobacillus alkalisoli]MCG5105361.1 tRNA (adenosine(37)-N6)-threonylcarbamoyltransferase complex ATPase subunit type 1 TsaE [Oceanobacillus alkalisoli]